MPDTATEMRPPRLAERWIETRLPAELAEAVSGDLHVEYVERRARSGRMRADLWYWTQALMLRGGSLRRASRRLAVVQPTHERSGPGRAARDHSFLLEIPMSVHDVKYALRRLLRTPGFTLVAVLSLALGIGANTAMFSIVNAVLLREIPVTNPEELVEVYTSEDNGFAYSVSSHPDYLDIRERATAFENVIGSRTTIARVDLDGQPRVAFGELLSWDYFQALGIEMELGRSFVEEEDRTAGTHPVTILGYRMWTQDFGADPRILGESIELNGRPYTVIGVAPAEYTGSFPVLVSSFFVPLMMTNEIMGSAQLERRRTRGMFLKARLGDGVSVDRANAELATIGMALAEEYPETNENRALVAVPSGDVSLHPAVDGALAPVAGLLLGVVGLVLLIACANLASFLMARAEDRRKEIAVRLALGAGRQRLIGQLLVETTMIALLGGVAGVVLAQWTVGLMMALQPPMPIPVDIEISLDRTVLAFTAGVSLFAGFLFGLAPALQATNPDLAPTLKSEGTAGAGRRRWNLRNGLVVTQVAFSFVLLIGAGLFVRSLQKAQRIDPGFDVSAGALVWPMPELSGYETPDEVRAFYAAYEERLLADPAVTGVALADRLPLGSGIQTADYILPGVPSDLPNGEHEIDNATINDGYFEAMGIDLLAGRTFSDADMGGPPVIVVSEAFVTRYFPGEDVVGRLIQDGAGEDLQIVGVAENTKVRTLGEDPRPYVYHLQGQMTFFGMQVVVKGRGTSEELAVAARTSLDDVAPNMVLFEEIKTMNEHLALLLFPPRMAALLLTVFGGLALVLAGVGIYGVVSYAVAKRTRELGIRMSLGASARDVVGMAIGGGMRLVAIGGVVGVALAAAVTWSISSYLFGISPTDVATFVAIPLLLTTVALVAAWVPARRASGVDPVSALRSE
ncbi:MAG: ADOP family duplicated permease [Gemmatimonadota bacterium]